MFQNKLVAVVNKQIEMGVAMNALAHMCLGFGAHMGASELHIMDYENADGFIYPNISKMPFIILKEKNSNKIANLLMKANEAKIQYSVFTNTMTEGTWEDQKARTLAAKHEEIIFYGIVLFGQAEIVTEMTRKLSLWRNNHE
jgi:CRISPR/Cas system-associated endoribonuclease Cas2